MSEYGCNSIIFSSSATVYGEPQYLPYDESHPLVRNVYGRMYFIEEIIRDWAKAGEKRKGILRYFNPVGAHRSGRIGENPMASRTIAVISQVAMVNVNA